MGYCLLTLCIFMQSMSESNFTQNKISQILFKPNFKAFWQLEEGFQRCGFLYPTPLLPGLYSPKKPGSNRVKKKVLQLPMRFKFPFFLISLSWKIIWVNKIWLSKIWVDDGRKFYNKSMKPYLQDNNKEKFIQNEVEWKSAEPLGDLLELQRKTYGCIIKKRVY